MKIAIIGTGFVGHAVEKGFSPFSIMKTYDIDPTKCANTFDETIRCDFVFVCLPTPMVDAEGGEANLDILEDFFNRAYDSFVIICNPTGFFGITAFFYNTINFLAFKIFLGVTPTISACR